MNRYLVTLPELQVAEIDFLAEIGDLDRSRLMSSLIEKALTNEGILREIGKSFPKKRMLDSIEALLSELEGRQSTEERTERISKAVASLRDQVRKEMKRGHD